MRYRLEISAKALAQLRNLPKDARANIGWRLEQLAIDLQGDVAKLKAHHNRYRLRVGKHRVLFALAGDAFKFML